MNLNHYEMWSTSKAQAPTIINALRDGKPCQACGKPIAKAHACHVIRQMAILHDLCSTNRCTEDVAHGRPVAPMPPKPEAQWQIPETGQRIKTSPRTALSFRSINSCHPGRDSADGTPTCAHCLCIQGSYFALRRHIETGCCKSFNPNRPLGSHIPMTWPELMTVAKNNETDLILRKQAFVQALRTVCALCGRHCTKPGALLQHHLQDHATVVQEASDRSTNLQNQAAALGRPCYCGNRMVRKGHQCVVFNQIAMLQVTANTDTEHPKPDDVAKKESPTAVSLSQVKKHDESELDAYWDHPDLRSSLNVCCQLCQHLLSLAELETHLMTSHATLAASALETYADCMSPRLDCCRFCLDSNGIEEFCPAALHLAFLRAYRQVACAPLPPTDGILRDQRGQRDGPSSGSSQKRGRPEELQSEHQDTLEHLQAQASTDQFLLFFQMNQHGVLPALMTQASTWKKDMEASKVSKPLRVVLFQLVCQTTLDRMLALAKVSQNSQEWEQAVKDEVITPEGKWPWLQWCSETKSLKQTTRPPLDMVKMQKHLENLVEAAQSDHHFLRFKSLKNTSKEIKRQQVCPFLLHLSLRDSALWELLNLLSHNLIWLVIQARVRSRNQRENPLATSLAKFSKQQESRTSYGRSSKRK